MPTPITKVATVIVERILVYIQVLLLVMIYYSVSIADLRVAIGKPLTYRLSVMVV